MCDHMANVARKIDLSAMERSECQGKVYMITI